MPKKRSLEGESLEKAIALKASGFSYNEVSNVFDVSKSAAYKNIKEKLENLDENKIENLIEKHSQFIEEKKDNGESTVKDYSNYDLGVEKESQNGEEYNNEKILIIWLIVFILIISIVQTAL